MVELGTGPNWNVVGALVLNTRASGKLIAHVNMDTEPNLEDYDVIIHVFYSPPAPGPVPGHVTGVFPDVLNTSARGRGDAQAEVDIDPSQTNDSICIIVVVIEDVAVPPPAYLDMPPPVRVPLK